MNIIRGKIPSAQKVVIYGPEGIGKTSFAACFPDPLFIDTEGGTKHIDVARLPAPTSWTMLLEQVQEVKKENTSVCKTLVLDTADWAEQLCIKHICDKYKKSGIEDFGYGKGYIYLKEEFGRLLNLLEDVIERGVNVAVTAHAKMRKFEQPDEMGAYDRWEMKLDKNVAPLIKEWADMVLFANYKVYTVKDEQTQRSKAQGGKRVLYASHHPCWDAKNRHGLPDEMPLDYTSIAPFLNNPGTSGANPATGQERENAFAAVQEKPITAEDDLSFDDIVDSAQEDIPEGIPRDLYDLMRAKEVAPVEIQQVVAQKGHFPRDMPVRDYPEEYVRGVLIAAWPQVWAAIEKNRKENLPF